MRRTNRATDRQLWYLRKLLREAFAKRVRHGLCLDEHHLDGVSFADASAAIDALKRLLSTEVTHAA